MYPFSVNCTLTLRLLPIPVGLLVYSLVPASAGGPPPPLTHPPFCFLSRTDEPAKTGTCARDRRALQQPALNVHSKNYDLT